jgi:hypothetical protein
MQFDKNIVVNFRNFLQEKNTINDAQNILKKYRNIQFDTYNLKDSRCIWMSLMIYKYKQEMDASDEIWNLSRNLILGLLKNDPNLESTIKIYLEEFIKWQNDDLNDLTKQISCNYYNLLQIKNSIENTKNIETINNWLPHYEELILKIRSYCKNINILEKLDDYIYNIEQEKFNIVKEIMNNAYWDKIQNDIEENNLDLVYSNLTELKTIIFDIIPKKINTQYIDEHFDIDYIKYLVNNKVIDNEYLLNLFNFIINILKEYDSKDNEKIYENEKENIKKLVISQNHLIRYIMEKLMFLSFDLKNRKALWNLILKK